MPSFLIALIPITLIGLWLVAAVLADEELRPTRKRGRPLRQLPHAATWAVLVFALVCGGLALWLGWLGYSEQTKEEIYVNLATSLGSIAVTVLVIDQLNRWRMAAERKREIIEQMGSPVNDAALEAVRLARKNGWLEDGSLKGAILQSANLQLANLLDANLKGANFVSANLKGAWLIKANLEGAVLWSATLKGAILQNANLEGAVLQRADLRNAILWRATLKGAILQNADLRDASLSEANLKGANLLDSTLEGARLEGANLKGADLEGANLRRARYDEYTAWPDGFDYVAAGAVSGSDLKSPRAHDF